MKNKVLVGEMAKLHNVSAQTLRYYDKIGLFTPEHIDKENNYRYYDINQFPILDCILFLKKLGIPLDEIKEYFHERDIDKMMSILKQQESMLKEEIEILSNHLNSIKSKIEDVEIHRNDSSIYEPSIKYFKKRKMIKYDFKNGGNSIDFEYGLKEIYKTVKDDISIFNSNICSIISKENTCKEKFLYLDAVGVILSGNKAKIKNSKIIEEGHYATLAFNGTDEAASEYYEKLINFINYKQYDIIGDSMIVTIIDSTFSDYSEEYIKEIQIPVDEKV
ncbi:MerR family transcriptional regulator [Clostridium ihumii]|uniref:MerR family transcriptional regulator n=1 Tax=Clostridium ihumii TaxID=1470356 RepID=UPI00058F7411|nr:MerR family transcriptional regulator [Clostridium ihumii]